MGKSISQASYIQMVGVVIMVCWIWGITNILGLIKVKVFQIRMAFTSMELKVFWRFTKRRLAKFNGVKSTFELHLKECAWRWRKSTREMGKELWKMARKK